MKKDVRVGLIGFGVIGSGVFELLKKNAGLISDRTDINLTITKICDKFPEKVAPKTGGTAVTGDWKEIVNDKDIDVVVELIGGINPAKDIVLESLKNGKSVVTANKKLLAECARELFSATTSSNMRLGFEASVGGGIPCLDALKSGLVANNFNSISGILNGTTNYILTRMEEGGLSFDEALREAQKEGFAEADPTFDVEGFDAGHKITLLAMLAFNRMVDYSAVSKEGITKISSIDMHFAREMGYVIKLLGIAKNVGGKIDIRVHPTMIRRSHQLASVRREFNAIMLDADMTGPVVLYGKGAGALPTASAVVSDIIRITQNSSTQDRAIHISGDAEMLPADNRQSRFYFRMRTEDSAGVLEKVAGVFSRNGMSIASVVQKEKDGIDNTVPLIIMTHKSSEEGMRKSLEAIKEFSFVREEVVVIRVED